MTEPKGVRPYGVLAHQMKDQLYMMREGFIYTSPWVVTAHTVRHRAAMLLTTKYAPSELSVNKTANDDAAAAIRPMAGRGLRATAGPRSSRHSEPNWP